MARKYAPLWAAIKEKGTVTINCDPSDIITITNMMRKEKNRDRNKPKDKILVHEILDGGSKIKFSLIRDESIRTLVL